MAANVIVEKIKRKQSRIIIGDAHSGIELIANKKRKTVYVSGWYDNIVGIEGAEIPLVDILSLFDVKKEVGDGV